MITDLIIPIFSISEEVAETRINILIFLNCYSLEEFIKISKLNFVDLYNLSTCCKRYIFQFHMKELDSSEEYYYIVDKYIMKEYIRRSKMWNYLSKFKDFPYQYFDKEKHYRRCIADNFYSTLDSCNMELYTVNILVAKIYLMFSEDSMMTKIFQILIEVNEHRKLFPHVNVDINYKLNYLDTDEQTRVNMSLYFEELINIHNKTIFQKSPFTILWKILDNYYSKIRLFKDDKKNNLYSEQNIHKGVLNFLLTNSSVNLSYDKQVTHCSIIRMNSFIYIFYKLLIAEDNIELDEITKQFSIHKAPPMYQIDNYRCFITINSSHTLHSSEISNIYGKSIIPDIQAKYLSMTKNYDSIYRLNLFNIHHIDNILNNSTAYDIKRILMLYNYDRCTFSKETTLKILNYCLLNKDKDRLHYHHCITDDIGVSFEDKRNNMNIDYISIFQILVKYFYKNLIELTYEFIIYAYLLDDCNIKSPDSMTRVLISKIAYNEKRKFLKEESDSDEESEDEDDINISSKTNEEYTINKIIFMNQIIQAIKNVIPSLPDIYQRWNRTYIIEYIMEYFPLKEK